MSFIDLTLFLILNAVEETSKLLACTCTPLAMHNSSVC
jgi:hypothetical protein